MTDDNSAAATAEPTMDSPVAGGSDERIAAIRQHRDVALQAGDRDTAQEFDALERELYDAEVEGAGQNDQPDQMNRDAAPHAFTEAGHAPLTSEEAAGVFAFLDEVDTDAAAALRAEWGGDAAANLGYAHLWFTTQYTQDERDSMVVTPGLVRMAARMGCGLAADRQPVGRHRPGGGRDAAEHGATSQSEKVGELRRCRAEAQRDGNYRLAQELDARERAAWARLDGDGPIVGRAGRTL